MRKDKTGKKEAGQNRFFSLNTPLLFLLFSCFPYFIYAQNHKTIPSQQLRGTVVDQFLQTPIEGASITISGTGRTVISDAKGNFRFDSVPIGIHHLIISNIAYKQVTIDNINLNSGKETVLNISMENKVNLEDGVIVKTSRKKNKPLNEMNILLCIISIEDRATEKSKVFP